MSDLPINNTVKLPVGTTVTFMRCTPQLKWYYPQGINGPKMLMQAWEDVDSGAVEWRVLPTEVNNG